MEAPQGGTSLNGNTMEAVRQAQDWKWAGDVALANHQFLEAAVFYQRIASAFPGTPYGRWAAERVRSLWERLREPARSPAKDDPWESELLDMVTWP